MHEDTYRTYIDLLSNLLVDYDIDKSARCLDTSRIRHQLFEGHACDKFLSFRVTPFTLSNLYPKNKDGTLTAQSAHLGDGP